MSRPRDLRPEEREVWARVLSDVKPLKGRSAPHMGAPKPIKASPPPHRKAARAASPRHCGPPTGRGSAGHTSSEKSVHHAARPPDRSHEKKVRRGQVEIDGRLDLHGLTQDQAQAALRGFVERGMARGARCLLVITGKGAGPEVARRFVPWWEEAPGVIKRRTPEWLASAAFAPFVAGVARAHQRHGGEGALYVFLRRHRQD